MIHLVQKYVKNSTNLHSLIGNVLFGIFGLLLFILMVQYLEKELYGHWIIFITSVTLLDMLRFGLSGTGAIRLIAISAGSSRSKNIAASYHVNILCTLIIAVIFLSIYLILKESLFNSYYLSVLLYYPFLAIANSSNIQSNTLSQATNNFKRVLVIRGLLGLLTLLFIGGYILFFESTIYGMINIYIIVNVVVSVFTIIKKWDGSKYIKHVDKQSIKNLLQFGKYSTASFVGSNLLRSSDTFILSMSVVLGAEAIAIYSIPLKFVELVEIPLRSFTATLYPKLSAAHTKSKTLFNNIFGQYLSYTMLLIAPIIIGIWLFSGYLLPLIGGEEYANSIELQQSLLYIISIYILILPLDRYSGMALFAINKPKQNFHKIIIMLTSNIIFDCIAVFFFHSLQMVALATVMFTFIGIIFGWYYIYRDTKLTIKRMTCILTESCNTILETVKRQFNASTKNFSNI